MKPIFIKPKKPELVIRDPATGQALNPEGEEKQDSSFWRRRIKDGSAVLAQPPAPKGKSAPATRKE